MTPTTNGPLKVEGNLEIVSGTGRTIDRVTRTFLCRCGHSNNKPYCDGAHGAAYRVAPLVFSELGADVRCIGVKPNGRNINHNVGALHPEHVVGEVWKPFDRPVDNPGQSLDRKAAEAQMDALG